MSKYLWVGVAALLCTAQAWAGEVKVSDAWARATAPGQSGAAIQFLITSEEDAYLLDISSPVAGAVEIHKMKQEGGVMKMRAVKSLPLPAGKQVDLGANGNHVMLLKLKQPLKEGDSVPLTLTIQYTDKRKESIKAKAEVRPLTASSDKHEHQEHEQHQEHHGHH